MPVHPGNLTSAYRRIWPEANYTGHDWDDVLGMYYAKARFYDPAAKRFVSMDPIKGNVTDPLSLVSYLYCVDNPLKYVDPLGLYYIYETSDGLYYARKESGLEALFHSSWNAVPFVGSLLDYAARAYLSIGAVGGSSYASFKGLLSQESISDTAKDVKSEMFSNLALEVAERFLEEAGKEALGKFFFAYDAASLLKTMGDALDLPRKDKVVFGLLNLAGIKPEGRTLAEVEFIMNAAYAFVEQNSWFFLDAPYEYLYGRNYTGYPIYIKGSSVYQHLCNLIKMKNQGKSETKINKEIKDYCSTFWCNTTHRNPVIENMSVVITDGRSGKVLQTASFYSFAMKNYELVYTLFVDSFSNYMKQMKALMNIKI